MSDRGTSNSHLASSLSMMTTSARAFGSTITPGLRSALRLRNPSAFAALSGPPHEKLRRPRGGCQKRNCSPRPLWIANLSSTQVFASVSSYELQNLATGTLCSFGLKLAAYARDTKPESNVMESYTVSAEGMPGTQARGVGGLYLSFAREGPPIWTPKSYTVAMLGLRVASDLRTNTATKRVRRSMSARN